jgi:hypothetical protein
MSPADSSFVRQLPPINGTVSDAGGSGLQRVTVGLFRDLPGTSQDGWWNGTTFTPQITELPTTVSSGRWSLSGAGLPSGAGLVEGLYVALAFAYDNAGNQGRSQVVVTVDKTAPTSVFFTSPVNGRLTSDLARITGRALDNTGGSGVTAVDLTIRRLSDNLYWNGSAWVAAPIRLSARSGGGFWSLSTALRPGPNLPNDSYVVTAFARDAAGNVSTSASLARVVGDLINPRPVWSSPINNSVSRALPALRGTVTDTGGSGVVSVSVGLLRLPDNSWWNGTTWTRAFTRLPARLTSGGAWQLLSPLPSGANLRSANYVAIAYATDGVGNEGQEDFFAIDTVAPLAPVIASPRNGSALTSVGSVVGTVRDAPNPGVAGSGVASVDIAIRRGRDGAYWTGSGWAFNTFFLPASVDGTSFRRDGGPAGTNLELGAYTVFVRATDRAGNTSSSSSAFTIRDSLAPTVTISFPANGQLLRSLSGINGTAVDNSVETVRGSSVAQVLVSLRRASDGLYWNGTAWSAIAASVPAALSADGKWTLAQAPTGANLRTDSYAIQATAIDRAGNRSVARASANVNTDATAPSLTIDTPTPNVLLRQLRRVSGTASDNPGGIGLDRVVVALQRQSDRLWWNGRAWTDTFTPLRATVTGNAYALTTGLPPTTATPAGSYLVIVQAFDRFNIVTQRQVVITLDPNSSAPLQPLSPSIVSS